MKKVFALVLTVLLLTTTVFAGAADRLSTTVTTAVIENTDGRFAVNDSGICARIGGVNIKKDLFNYIAYNMLGQIGNMITPGQTTEKILAQDLGNGVTVEEYIKKSTVSFLSQYIAVQKLAKECGIQPGEESSKHVEAMRENMVMQLGGEEAFKAYLSEMKVSEESLMKIEEWSYITDEYVAKATEEGSAAYVDEHIAEKTFKEKYFKIKLILLNSSPTFDREGNLTAAKSEDELTALSAEIIEKLDNGEDFVELSYEHNMDTGMDPDGFYVFTDGEMVPDIEDATKKLKPGEYTKSPVKGNFGYAIIKRYESIPEKDELSDMVQKLSEKKLVEIVGEQSEKLSVRLNEEGIKKTLTDLIESMVS